MTKHQVALPDGAFLNAEIDGPKGAPWLVLSNSVLTDLRIWDAQVESLAANHRLLRYDQRGHGESSLPTSPMSFQEYGDDLLRLLDAFGVEDFCYVGLSMGVPTGLAAFSKNPERFAAFVAVDGVAKSAREAFWTERRETAEQKGMQEIATGTAARWLPGLPETASQVRDLIAMIGRAPIEGFAAATQALAHYDFFDTLPQVTVPFLGVAGADDGAMPELMRKQFGVIRNARFHDIPDAGHVPNYQSPDAFNEILLGFLEAHLAARSEEIN